VPVIPVEREPLLWFDFVSSLDIKKRPNGEQNSSDEQTQKRVAIAN
jgi:hypothetical protein